MRTAVGIFPSREDAKRAFEGLRGSGFDVERLALLSPETSDMDAVPTTEAEAPGIGKALGGVVGGAAGLAGGGLLGAAATSLLVSGVGPVLAIGFVAAAGGAGGIVAGASAGDELDRRLSTGLPKDEVFFYEDALRKGRTVLIGLSDDEERLEAARQLLAREGAEALDAARRDWWIGVRDAENTEYEIPEAGTADESSYRLGFETALEPGARGKSYDEAIEYLKQRHPRLSTQEAFRRGFERGQEYHHNMVKVLHRSRTNDLSS